MLVECRECKKQISDQAAACPNCGCPRHPAQPADTATNASVPAYNAQTLKKRSPTFLVVAATSLVLALFTPRILLSLILLVVFVSGVLSLIRRETGRVGAVIILLLGVGLLVLNEEMSSSVYHAKTGEGQTHSVTYELSGESRLASITYRNESGSTEQLDVPIPHSIQFTAREGAFLYISAQNKWQDGSLTARILVDGVELKSATSYGEHKIASVSGTCCK